MSALRIQDSVWCAAVILVVFPATPVFGGRGDNGHHGDREDHGDRDDEDDEDSPWWQWVLIAVAALIILAIILCIIKRCTKTMTARKINKPRTQVGPIRERTANQPAPTARETAVTIYPNASTGSEPFQRLSQYPGMDMMPPPPYTFGPGEAPPAYDAPHHPTKSVHLGGSFDGLSSEISQVHRASVAEPQFAPSAPLAP